MKSIISAAASGRARAERRSLRRGHSVHSVASHRSGASNPVQYQRNENVVSVNNPL